MSAFKGTPGPWRFERVKLRSTGSPTFIHVVADDGPVVPWSGFDRSGRGERENSTNARLIAAAPELLEAMRQAFDFTPDFFDRSDDELEQITVSGRHLRMVRAAIAKAVQS